MMWTIIVGLAIQTFFSQSEKVEAEIFKSWPIYHAHFGHETIFFSILVFFYSCSDFWFYFFLRASTSETERERVHFLLMIILRNFSFDSLFFRAFWVNNFLSRARIKVLFLSKDMSSFFASFVELIVELVIGIKRYFCVGTAYLIQKSFLLSQMINRCTDHVRFRTWLEVGMFWENF